jgi:hypothetical protein
MARVCAEDSDRRGREERLHRGLRYPAGSGRDANVVMRCRSTASVSHLPAEIDPCHDGGEGVAVLRRMCLVSMAMVLVAACEGDTIDFGGGVMGSGTMASASRDVTGFDSVVIAGSGTATIEVTGVDSLTIEAEDNILPLLTSNVSGTILELGVESSISPTRPITYSITVASLSSIEILGNANVMASGVDSDALRVVISGSSVVSAAGTATEVDVEISGSGSYAGSDLVASIRRVEITGYGTATVNATEELHANISGSGTIRYLGDPSVTESVSGSGTISRQ